MPEPSPSITVFPHPLSVIGKQVGSVQVPLADAAQRISGLALTADQLGPVLTAMGLLQALVGVQSAMSSLVRDSAAAAGTSGGQIIGAASRHVDVDERGAAQARATNMTGQ